MRRLSAFLLVALLVVSLGTLVLKGSVPSVPTGTWVAGRDMTMARTGATAIPMPDGRVLIAGGKAPDGTILADAEVYNTDGSFSAVTPMHVARIGHAAILLFDGYVLVTGGTTVGGGITNSAEMFDVLTDSWTLLPATLLEARTGHTATQLWDGNVLIAGGEGSNGTITALETFSLVAEKFSFSGALTTGRKGHVAAALHDDRVLIAGGTDASGNTLASTIVYDPNKGTVTAGPDLVTPRVAATATTLLDGRVLIAGGSYPEGAQNGISELGTAELFDPSTGAMTVVAAPLAYARAGQQAFLLPNNNNVMLLGGTYGGSDVPYVEQFVPWTAQFTATTQMSFARNGAGGAPLSAMDGLLLVAGGSNQQSAELYRFATIKTDRSDYGPGDPVDITGTGWMPGETVTLNFREVPAGETVPSLTAVADAFGNIENSDFVPDALDLDVRFYLTAVGAHSQAQTTFTDSQDITVVISPAGAGSVTSAGLAISCPSVCGPANAATNATVTLTATPNSGYRFTTWSSTSGTYGCNGLSTNPCTWKAQGGNGHSITVTAKFANDTKLAITTVNGGANPKVATAFTVVVQSQSASGAAANVAANTAVSLSRTTGTGTLGGTLTGTILAGQSSVTISGVTYSIAETGVVLTATRTSGDTLTAGASSAFTVNGNATKLAYTIVPTTGTSGTAFSVTVQSQDVNGSPVSPTSNTTITLSKATGGGALSGTLTGTIPTSGNSVTIATPVYSKSDTMTLTATATAGQTGLSAVTSGNIVFSAGAATKLVYTAQPAGAVVGTTFTTQPSLTVQDAGGNVVTNSVAPVTLAIGANPSSGTLSGTKTVNAIAGVATFGGLSLDKAGNGYTLAATSSGLTGATSGTFNVAAANTTTTVASSDGPSVYGTPVTFTATLTPSLATGTVTFKNGATTLGTGTLSGGIATYTTTAGQLAVGANSITAVYGADANYLISTSSTLTQTVNAKSLTVNGISAANKTYDGTTSTTLIGTGSLNGAIAGDTVTLTGTAAGTFASANIGSNVAVTITGLSLGGGSAANYTLTAPTSSADITAKTVTPVVTINNKSYDGTTAATIATSGVTGVLPAESANVSLAGGTATFADATPGTGKTVTVIGLTLTGTASGNYQLLSTTASTTADIAKATTTATVSSSAPTSISPQSVTFTATISPSASGTPTGTVTFKDGGTTIGTGTLSGGTATYVTSTLTPGVHTITVVYAGDPNFVGSTSSVLTQTVNLPPAITSGASATFITGTAGSFTVIATGYPAPTFTATGPLPSGVTLSAAGVLGGTPAANAGGGYPVTIKATNGIGTDATQSFTLTVNQPPVVTTQPSNQTITYGQSPTVSALASGYPVPTVQWQFSADNGASWADIPGANTATVTYPANLLLVAYNGYQFHATFTNAAGTVVSNPATMTINRATLTAAVVGAPTRLYGANNPAFSTAISGYVNGDTSAVVSGASTCTTTATTASPVGNYPITCTTGTLYAANYTFAFTAGILGVTPAPLTVTADAKTKVYGATLPTFTATALGLVNSDTLGSLGTLSFTSIASPTSPVGSYTINPGGLTSTNYTISYVPANLAITAASLTPVITANSKPYDGTMAATIATRSVTGKIGTDDVNVTGGTATFADANVGIGKTVAATGLSLTGTAAGNYQLGSTTATTTANITAVSLTPSITASNKPYDGTTTAVILTRTVTGVLPVDNANVSLTSGTATFADANVGIAKTVTATGLSLAGTAAGNYQLVSSTATTAADITPMAVLITPTSGLSKVYGTSDPALTFTNDGGLSAFTGTLKRAAGESVGSYAINMGTLSAGSNYILTLAAGTVDFVITPKTASVTPATAGKNYGDIDPSLTGTLSGFLTGDNVTANFTRTAGETVGSSPYTISATLSPASVLGNYNVTYKTANFTINTRAVMITADAKSKTFGDSDPVLTYQVTGGSLLTGDAFTGALSRAGGESVGAYAIQQGTIAINSNYALNFIGANVTITKANAVISVTPYSVIFDSQAHTATGTATGVGGVSLGGLNLVGTTHAATGTYASDSWAFTDATGNYNDASGTVSDTIEQATPAITWGNPADINYGTPLSATQLNASATVAGTYSYTPALGAMLSTGIGQTLSVTLTPTDAANYKTATKSVTINVNKAVLSVTAANVARVYGDANPSSFAYNVTGFVNGDGASAVTTAPVCSTTATVTSFVASSPYPITCLGAASANYTFNYVPGALTITPAALTVTANNATRAQSLVNPTFTGTLAGVKNGDRVSAIYGTTADVSSPIGTYPITATLSDGGTGALGNYLVTNNSGILKVIPNGVDLTEANLSVSGTAGAGTTLQVTDTASNAGSKGSGSFFIRYYLSKTLLKADGVLLSGSRQLTVASQSSNTGTATVTVPVGTAAGAFNIIACADDTNAVVETDETNNCSSAPVTVSGLDLTEDNVSVTGAAGAGVTVQVTDRVSNSGPGVTGSFYTRYYLSKTLLKSDGVLLTGSRQLTVAGGTSNTGTATVMIPVGTAAGTYNIIACADDINTVPETDETNNCSPASVTVTGLDLTEDNVSVTGATIIGGAIQVTDRVSNSGPGNTSSFAIRYYLSKTLLKADGTLISGSRYAAVTGGSSNTGTTRLTIPLGASAGTYNILACADDTNLVPETNENNNCNAAQITVTAK